MQENSFYSTLFYHYFLGDMTLLSKVEPRMFDKNELKICFELAKEYVVKYKEAPTAEQLKELIKVSGKTAAVPENFVDILYTQKANLAQYGPDWLYETATTWAQMKNFCEALQNTIAYTKLHLNDWTPENGREIMEHARATFVNNYMIDFSDVSSEGSDFWDAESHKQRQLVRSSTGYPFIDLCLKGGTFPGCLFCFVGAPKIGKSLWLQNMCAKSMLKGEDNCYISLELPEEMITNRIGANILNIPAMDYEKYAENVEDMTTRMTAIRRSSLIPPGRLTVKSFPTSTLSVPELESWLLKREEEISAMIGRSFKFKNIYVDYINIMKNWRNPNTENTYMKIKQLAEDLKAMGLRNSWAIITATQTKITAVDMSDMSSTQVSESFGLNATVDLLMGIIADPIMKAKGEYYLKCLLDRVAPEDNKRKKFINDKTYLRITEDMNSEIEEITDFAAIASPVNTRSGSRQTNFNNKPAPTQSNPGELNLNAPIQPVLDITTLPSAPPAPGINPTAELITISGSGLF